MAPNRIKWVSQFRVEDPQRHIKGFTVYKLTSVVSLLSLIEKHFKINPIPFLYYTYNNLWGKSRVL